MANWYIRSSGTASGARGACGWIAANAANGTIYASLAAALSASPAPVAGDTFCVADDSQETYGAIQALSFPGTPTNPNDILSCDYTSSTPQTALFAQTASSGFVKNTSSNVTLTGSFYSYGIVLQQAASPQLGSVNDNVQVYDSWLFQQNGTNANLGFSLGGTGGAAADVTFVSCGFQFSNAGQAIHPRGGRFKFVGGSIGLGGTSVTNAFSAGSFLGTVDCFGVDLSAISGAIVADFDSPHIFWFYNCKAPTGVQWNGSAAPNHPRVDTFDSDTTGTNYRSERYWFQGAQTVDTSHYRTGGASIDGTPLAWAISTPASGLSWSMPFETQPLAIDCSSTGSHTISVYLLGPSGLHNDDVWIEVIYKGSGTTTLGTVLSTSKASVAASNAALPTDPGGTGGWSSTSGITGPTAYLITTPSFSVGKAGIIQVRVKAAKNNVTFYVDPLLVLT